MDDRLHPLTLTHAMLRRAQGDIRGAIAVLEAMIDAGEEGEEIWRSYMALAGESHRPHDEPQPVGEEARVPAEAKQLARAFQDALEAPDGDPRVERLRRLLGRLQDEQG